MSVLVLLVLLIPSLSNAATWTVGPGKQYALPCQAIMAATTVDGDTIEIEGADSAGNQLEYRDDFCTWSKLNLTIRGMWNGSPAMGNKRPHIRRVFGRLQGEQGMWRALHTYGTNTTLTVENIEASGTKGTSVNSVPVWVVSTHFVVRNVYFHDNDNGILTTNEAKTSDLRLYDTYIENSEFAFNGTGETVAAGGQQHNLYIGEQRQLTVKNCFIHDSKVGQGIKSRAGINYILNNRIVDSAIGTRLRHPTMQPPTLNVGLTNYEIDLSWGGRNYIIGNIIYQATTSPQKIMVMINAEVATPTTQNMLQELYITNNTFIDTVNTTAAVMINTRQVMPSPVVIKNNIFAGVTGGTTVWKHGLPDTAQTNPIDNVYCTTVASCGFVDPVSLNFHLTAGSPAVGAGNVDAGLGAGYSLAPTHQPIHPASAAVRTTLGGTRDAGAYEFGGPDGTQIDAPQLAAVESSTNITVQWAAAVTDVAPISGYRLFRNGTLLTTVVGALQYVDTTAAADTIYAYHMIADTASSGSSPQSNTIQASRIKQVTGTLAPGYIGWQQILNTKLDTVCQVQTGSKCFNVTQDKPGLTYDSTNNRILVWGDGLGQYPGNEVYAFNAGTLSWQRLNDSDPIPLGDVEEVQPAGGRPNARRPFNNMAWVPSIDKMYHYGSTGFGFNSQISWLFTPTTNTWQRLNPTGTGPGANVFWGASVYVSATQQVAFVHAACTNVFNFSTVTWSKPQVTCNVIQDYTLNATYDPDHNRVYYLSGGVYGYLDVADNYKQIVGTHPSCTEMAHGYPGITWDSVQKKVVAYIGGNLVFYLDPVSNTCTTVDIPGGPGFPLTLLVGRKFQYVPPLDGYIVINESTQDTFFLRTNAGTPINPIPPTGRGSGTCIGCVTH